ncbi:hypothetical protein GCM10020260_23000 [Nesterenkonia halobia]|uniref:Uncharacterized protein n=1 Tax=Nesterenkonia halobia TaxID=37922 RepID=A0ABP6RF13_9MICC
MLVPTASSTTSYVSGAGGEILGEPVDDQLCAQLPQQMLMLGGADRRDRSPAMGQQLHRRRADGPCSAVDQDAFPRLHPGAPDRRAGVVGAFGARRRVIEVDALRHPRDRGRLPGRHQLGMRAEPALAVAEDAVSRAEARDPSAHGDDVSGVLGAQDGPARATQAGGGAQDPRPRGTIGAVGAVHRGGADADEHLVVGRLRRRDVDHLHDVRRAVLRGDRCPHQCLLTRSVTGRRAVGKGGRPHHRGRPRLSPPSGRNGRS